jgi:hypothetical protein
LGDTISVALFARAFPGKSGRSATPGRTATHSVQANGKMEIGRMISIMKQLSQAGRSCLGCRAEDIKGHGVFWPAALA